MDCSRIERRRIASASALLAFAFAIQSVVISEGASESASKRNASFHAAVIGANVATKDDQVWG